MNLGKSILHVDNEVEGLARFLDVEEVELRKAVETGKKQLLAARQQRVPPARDDKILLAWNGMMNQRLCPGASGSGRGILPGGRKVDGNVHS